MTSWTLLLNGRYQTLDRDPCPLADANRQRQRRGCLLQPDLRDHRTIASDIHRERCVLDANVGHVLSECVHTLNVNVMNVNVKHIVNVSAWPVIFGREKM